MVLSSSYSVWKSIEELKSKEQMRLLRWQLQAREPIHRFSDMKAGDHLVRKSSLLGTSYEHHFICIGSECKGRPEIVHYYNTAANATPQMISTSGFGSGTANGQIARVQVMTLPHKDFIKDENELQAEGREVERVVWPEELRRFSVLEVISRALKKKGEEFYDLLKNNCETFVMWCLCGLKVSLQVTPLRKALYESGSGALRSIRHGVEQIFKVGTELLDDFAAAIGRCATRRAVGQAASKGLSKIGAGVGAAVTVIIEALTAGYDIHNAYKKWKAEENGSREDFIKEVAEIVLLALFRSGGSIVGMIVGQVVIPIPVVGGLVGAVVGVFAGHLIGKGLLETSYSKTLAHFIETKIAQKLDK